MDYCLKDWMNYIFCRIYTNLPFRPLSSSFLYAKSKYLRRQLSIWCGSWEAVNSYVAECSMELRQCQDIFLEKDSWEGKNTESFCLSNFSMRTDVIGFLTSTWILLGNYTDSYQKSYWRSLVLIRRFTFGMVKVNRFQSF